jgi:hypothetical protein
MNVFHSRTSIALSTRSCARPPAPAPQMSSAVSGGAARATSSPQEQLSIGRALLQQKKYTDASEALSLALEMFVQAFGEVGAECAEVYATHNLRAKTFCARKRLPKRLPSAVTLPQSTRRCALSPPLTRVPRGQVLLLRPVAVSRRGGE